MPQVPSQASSTSPVFSVRTTREHRPPTGVDTAILRPPDDVYVGEPPGVDVRRLGLFLRGASELLAETNGKVLHHAEWVLTTDPDVLRAVQVHRCPTCLAGLDQALAALAEHPDQALLSGRLYWAG